MKVPSTFGCVYHEVKKPSIHNTHAIEIYELYASKVRPGRRARSILSICNILKKGEFDFVQLTQAVIGYTGEMSKDMHYRLLPSNFFGIDECFRDYLKSKKENPEWLK